jgi:hypothetical protein
MNQFVRLVLLLALASQSTGCVIRKYVITSDPPGALVYRNGEPIGATPVEEHFVYHGKYHFRLVKDGYQTLEDTPNLAAPWYELPGLDFVSENMVPCKIRDVHRLHYQLIQLAPYSPAEVKARGEELRTRGQAIQPLPSSPKIELPPRRPPATPPAAAPTVPLAPGNPDPLRSSPTRPPVPDLGPEVPAPVPGTLPADPSATRFPASLSVPGPGR